MKILTKTSTWKNVNRFILYLPFIFIVSSYFMPRLVDYGNKPPFDYKTFYTHAK